jgi:signal peptidase I
MPMFNEPGDAKVIEEKNSSVKVQGHDFLKEVFKFALIAFLVVVPIRVFIAQPFLVNGASMSPTFENGNYLIIDEISYRFNEPERGDVVVFKYPKDPSKFFIKRIIGLPGEGVEIREGEVFILDGDGSEIKIEENYVINKSSDDFNLTLNEKEYFVLGDNRPSSSDSRIWGVLPKKLIKGRAFLRLLPINKLGVFPGSLENQ